MMTAFQREGGPGGWAGLEPLTVKPFELFTGHFFPTYFSVRVVSHAHVHVHSIA